VPVLADLVRHGIIQYWAVGEASHEGEGWWSLSAEEHPDTILGRLNLSRRDELRFTVPGLELQRVMVLERVRLYDQACEQRTMLLKGFEYAHLQASENDAAASGAASKAFEYDWLAMVDGGWAGGRPDAQDQGRATRIIQGLRTRRTFYVDQQSAARGIVPAEDADQVLAHLAIAVISSDLGFPRPNAGDEGRSRTAERPAPEGTVTPIGMLTLVHRREQFARQRARTLLRQILRGPADDVPDLLEPTIGQAPTLVEAFREELKDLENGASGLKARRRRLAAIRATVARYLADRSPIDGQVAVSRLRSAIAGRRQQGAYSHQASTASAVAALSVPGGATVTVAVAFLVIAGFAAWFFRRRVNETATDIVVQPINEEAELARALALKDWDGIADALDVLFAEYRKQLDEWDNGAAAVQQPWDRGEFAYHWQLGSDAADADRSKATAWLYETLGTLIAERLQRATVTGELLDTTLVAVAEKELADGNRKMDEQLRPLLEAPHNRVVLEAVRGMSPLANVIGGARIQEVAWLAASDASYGDLLVKMERAPDQDAARVLVSDDHSQTVRVVFGEDVPWRSISSLGYLPHNINPSP
jgi:hypothetical protein